MGELKPVPGPHAKKSNGGGPLARKKQYTLERGWVTRKLIIELARQEKTRTKLASEYGVTTASITTFAHRHRTEIDEVKADIENEFAGLWIAQKYARIAEYQADVDAIGDTTDPDLLKVKHTALKAVAEEMGQLPARVAVNVESKTVNYTINGIDPGQLR